MILKSMREFVLEQCAKINDAEILARTLVKHAEFLGLELNLGMFVAAKFVNEEWVVLEEPNEEDFKEIPFDFEGKNYLYSLKEFQEAKQRILFKGFTYHKGLDKNNPDFWFVRNSSCKIHDYEFEVQKLPLETFANRNYLIELTPTAQKQIELTILTVRKNKTKQDVIDALQKSMDFASQLMGIKYK
jgi:hypothetical protein